MSSSYWGSSIYILGHGHWGMDEELPPLLMRHGGARLLGRHACLLICGLSGTILLWMMSW
jgi:hypothetical protein